MKEINSYLTWILTAAIVVVFFIALFWFLYQRKRGQLIEKKRWIEYLPSLISTLGVLGTFIGITVGLLGFETTDLDNSIPLLLDGLKTAFFTSLAGMVGSLILSRVVNKAYDDHDKGISDINSAAVEIVQAVQNMSRENKETIDALKDQAEQSTRAQQAFYASSLTKLDSMYTEFGNIGGSLNNLIIQANAQTDTLKINKESLSSIVSNNQSLLSSIGNIEEKANQLHSTLSHIDSDVAELKDGVEAIVSTDGEISEKVSKVGEKLHDEVVDIEDKMNETNKLLELKFDEFSDLLKKSNTEALVDVMKKVSEEFQSQMTALIDKLVKENFEQLNNSVERLNTWQQENKAMIASLTSQYKEMAKNFEGTSDTLSKVQTDTQLLISEGGKLHQIVNALNKVMVEDEKFIAITQNLSDTTVLTKSNFEKFDEATNKLNEWVRKQRNFVDGVTLLINKLDEIAKIKDYNDEFWKGTKKNLEEGVGIIKSGSDQLNASIKIINQEFYSRLSATLAELDTCIQSMIEGK